MTPKNFNLLLEARIELMRSTLAAKSAEYSTQEDKLHNFKRAGAMRQETPEQALLGMATKHFISILDIVDNIDMENKRIGLNIIFIPEISEKMIEEKIGDAINYLILLEALLKERIHYGEVCKSDSD